MSLSQEILDFSSAPASKIRYELRQSPIVSQNLPNLFLGSFYSDTCTDMTLPPRHSLDMALHILFGIACVSIHVNCIRSAYMSRCLIGIPKALAKYLLTTMEVQRMHYRLS